MAGRGAHQHAQDQDRREQESIGLFHGSIRADGLMVLRIAADIQPRERDRSMPKDSTWFVYLLRCADGSLYTGITNDLSRRFRQHMPARRRATPEARRRRWRWSIASHRRARFGPAAGRSGDQAADAVCQGSAAEESRLIRPRQAHVAKPRPRATFPAAVARQASRNFCTGIAPATSGGLLASLTDKIGVDHAVRFRLGELVPKDRWVGCRRRV